MKRETVLIGALIVFSGVVAARWVPLGAPADAPPIGPIMQEGNKASTSLNMSFYGINSVAAPVSTNDAATKGYVDNQIIAQSSDDQNLDEVLGQNNDMNGHEIIDSQGPITFGGGDVEIPDGNLTISNGDVVVGQRLELQGNADFGGNEAKNFVFDKRSSDPSSPEVGQMWYRTDMD